MKEAAYKAYNFEGHRVEGVMQGESEQEILSALKKKGLCVVSIAPKKNKKITDSLVPTNWFKKVSRPDLIAFTRQFHTLFQAGMSMDLILATLIKQTTNPTLKEALHAIAEDIQQGLSLSKAFAKHPDIFDALYISMLMAGEEAGILEQALAEIGGVLERENELHQEVKSATLYPKLVTGAMVIAFWVMMTFVIPKFSALFARFNTELPLPTRIMIGMSRFATNYWYIVLLGIFSSVFIAHHLLQRPVIRFKWDLNKLKIPVFGPLFQKIAVTRFGRLFASLYRSGLPLVHIFEILASLIGNEAYALEIGKLREGVLRGKTISETMRHTTLFPVILVETVAVGEQSGSLDTMLIGMANHFDAEVKHITKNLNTLLEPALLLIMFGMVSLLAFGVFLPMWNLAGIMTK